MTLFVDSGVWYAALDRGDTDHLRATAVLAGENERVTSDYVLAETWRLVAHRLGHEVAERFWQGLRLGAAKVESVELVDRESAWAIGRRFPDQEFSLVDRTSFALMERLGLRRVAAFDSDFAIYRFGVRGEQAFTVVR